MEQITFEMLKNFLVVLMLLFGAIYAAGGAINTIKGWRKPKVDAEADTQKTLKDHKDMLDRDKRKLDCHDKQLEDIGLMNVAMCKALNALLMHGISGNSTDKLREAKDGLDKYLIEAGGKA